MATHCFPTFAKVYGWCYILYLFNQAFLSYFYPDRIFGVWSSYGGWYQAFEQANWHFGGRNFALSILGVFALASPIHKFQKSCIYLFSAFWIGAIVVNFCDAGCAYWYVRYDRVAFTTQLAAGGMIFNNMILAVFNTAALHMTWQAAYPPGCEIVYNKPTHKNPIQCKILGWIFAAFSLFTVIFWWFAPDEKNFFEKKYRRWFGTSATYYTAVSDQNSVMYNLAAENVIEQDYLYGYYFDMMICLIANREAILPFFAAIAQWKDCENLRYWLAFWLYAAGVSLVDGFGALEYYEQKGRKWAAFIGMIFVGLPVSIYCFVTIFNQIKVECPEGGEKKATANPVETI